MAKTKTPQDLLQTRMLNDGGRYNFKICLIFIMCSRLMDGSSKATRAICDNDRKFIVVSKAAVEDKRITVRIGIDSRASLGFVLNSQASQRGVLNAPHPVLSWNRC